MFRETLTIMINIMMIIFLFFVGRRWLQKEGMVLGREGGASRQTELRLMSVLQNLTAGF